MRTDRFCSELLLIYGMNPKRMRFRLAQLHGSIKARSRMLKIVRVIIIEYGKTMGKVSRQCFHGAHVRRGHSRQFSRRLKTMNDHHCNAFTLPLYLNRMKISVSRLHTDRGFLCIYGKLKFEVHGKRVRKCTKRVRSKIY